LKETPSANQQQPAAKESPGAENGNQFSPKKLSYAKKNLPN
jgi:hypothetical protein